MVEKVKLVIESVGILPPLLIVQMAMKIMEELKHDADVKSPYTNYNDTFKYILSLDAGIQNFCIMAIMLGLVQTNKLMPPAAKGTVEQLEEFFKATEEAVKQRNDPNPVDLNTPPVFRAQPE